AEQDPSQHAPRAASGGPRTSSHARNVAPVRRHAAGGPRRAQDPPLAAPWRPSGHRTAPSDARPGTATVRRERVPMPTTAPACRGVYDSLLGTSAVARRGQSGGVHVTISPVADAGAASQARAQRSRTPVVVPERVLDALRARRPLTVLR